MKTKTMHPCTLNTATLKEHPYLSIPQVLDWVEQHGEVFLNKHSGVGKTLHRARALQKRHDDFQQVAQVTSGISVREQFRGGVNAM